MRLIEKYTSEKNTNEYTALELKRLLQVAEGTVLEIPLMLAVFYCLRRGEMISLKWESIDFDKNEIRMTTKTGVYLFPLIPNIRERLWAYREIQEARAQQTNCTTCLEYVCVDVEGKHIDPDRFTRMFRHLLKQNDLPVINLHELRMWSQKVLYTHGASVRVVLESFGASAERTMLARYGHGQLNAGLTSAEAMQNALGWVDCEKKSSV